MIIYTLFFLLGGTSPLGLVKFWCSVTTRSSGQLSWTAQTWAGQPGAYILWHQDCGSASLYSEPWVNPKGNQSLLFIGRTDAEAEAPILWPPDAKGRLIGKDPDARKDWGQEEKGAIEDKVVGWHHQLNRHEFEQTRTWVWADSGTWVWADSGVLQSMGSQRAGRDWATEQQ